MVRRRDAARYDCRGCPPFGGCHVGGRFCGGVVVCVCVCVFGAPPPAGGVFPSPPSLPRRSMCRHSVQRPPKLTAMPSSVRDEMA